MAPKRKSGSQNGSTPKRPRKVMNLTEKVEVLNKLKSGEKISEVAKKFKVNESTIRGIRDSGDKIRESVKKLGAAAALSKVSRKANVERMEDMLKIWIEDKNRKKIPLSSAAIRQQAVNLYEFVIEKYGQSAN